MTIQKLIAKVELTELVLDTMIMREVHQGILRYHISTWFESLCPLGPSSWELKHVPIIQMFV